MIDRNDYLIIHKTVIVILFKIIQNIFKKNKKKINL